MAHHIAKQVHDKFKIFSGELAADGTIGKLADEVAAFANTSKIAAKSIGVAHIEPGQASGDYSRLSRRRGTVSREVALSPSGESRHEGRGFSCT